VLVGPLIAIVLLGDVVRVDVLVAGWLIGAHDAATSANIKMKL
jgi:hypothetical protein